MKEWADKYNPFNSMKALKHVEYWEPIVNGVIPPPRFVSIDPCATCNLKCTFCNATESFYGDRMDKELCDKIVKQLVKWGTKATCCGGGGEPLLNENMYGLIEQLHGNNIQVGLVTNGTIVKHPDILTKCCKWIGISVDATTEETYAKIKGVDRFDDVLENIRRLTNKGCEITYKFLLTPENQHEIYHACYMAACQGCDLIHIRPGSQPWFKQTRKQQFNLVSIREQIERARRTFENDNFKIYGISHKFNPDLSVKKSFNKCYACMTTCYIDSRGMVGLCCDRRGDKKIELCHIDEVDKYWGSDKHKEIFESIDVSKCPRCTYSHVNEIFENVIIDDKMNCDMY